MVAMKKLIANLSLSLFSMLLFFLILEFIVFRFILLAPDLAIPEYVDDLIRYKANHVGTFRVKNEIASEFRINSNGWNSKYQRYNTTKDPEKYRIAIIGDSYIAGYQVDYKKSVAEQLESKLGPSTEVYRFGIDGAPLSQYLEMLRKEVLKFSPDMVIINIVHNDFNESYSTVGGVFRSSFLKLKIENSRVIEEIAPTKYQAPWYSWIREGSATWKYLAYRQQIRFDVLRSLILGKNHSIEYRANIDTNRLKEDLRNNAIITDYILKQIKEICDAKGIELIVLMDADNEGIYEKDKLGKITNTSILSLNKVAATAAKKHGIHFIDLHGLFEKEYSINKKRFSFINDGHWNEYVHNLVADILEEYIDTEIKPKHLKK